MEVNGSEKGKVPCTPICIPICLADTVSPLADAIGAASGLVA